MFKSCPEYEDYLAAWPWHGQYHNGPRRIQDRIFGFCAQNKGEAIIEGPTGSGKTVVQYTILKAFEKIGVGGTLYWVVPNKVILSQHAKEFPGVKVVYGQNEHVCPWSASAFSKENGALVTQSQLSVIKEQRTLPSVDEIPYLVHKTCPHYVDQQTGQVREPGVLPCQYYLDRYNARQGGIVLCTMAFYLYANLFIPKDRYTPPAALVIDEVHTVGDIVRSCLSFDITDWHLEQCIALLKRVECGEWKTLRNFRIAMRSIVKRKSPGTETPLKDEEVRRLLDVLLTVDGEAITTALAAAMSGGLVDRVSEMSIVRRVEMLAHDLRRYITSFEYSLETDERKPLQYTCAFYVSEKAEGARVQYKLVVRAWYVAGLMRKILSPHTMSFSATIGKDPDNLTFDSGIRGPFLRVGSNFPVENTRIYVPTDTPDLAFRAQKRRGTPRVLGETVRYLKQCADKGVRSLVIVVSEKERQLFLQEAAKRRLKVVSYQADGRSAREAALAFRDNGEGDCLVGSGAQYMTGIDLPYKPDDLQHSTPIIVILRPAFPNPQSAEAIFASKRFGGARYWKLQTWKVMLAALQGRGRNVRGVNNIGCAIFLDQRFRNIVWPVLPVWLEKAYRGEMTFRHVVKDAVKFVLRKEDSGI